MGLAEHETSCPCRYRFTEKDVAGAKTYISNGPVKQQFRVLQCPKCGQTVQFDGTLLCEVEDPKP